jgi:hypothetical protein
MSVNCPRESLGSRSCTSGRRQQLQAGNQYDLLTFVNDIPGTTVSRLETLYHDRMLDRLAWHVQ